VAKCIYGFFSKTLDNSKARFAARRWFLTPTCARCLCPAADDEKWLAELEEKFLLADMGVKNVERVIGEIRERWRLGKIKNAGEAEQIVRDQILEILTRCRRSSGN